jgi:hypothetical protein
MTEEYKKNMIENSKNAFLNLKDAIENQGWEGTAVLSEADANTILQFYIESIEA